MRVLDIISEAKNDSEEAADEFLNGYRSVKSLDSRWIETLPDFGKLRDLITVAKMCRSFDGVTPGDNPKWFGDFWARWEEGLPQLREQFARPLRRPEL